MPARLSAAVQLPDAGFWVPVWLTPLSAAFIHGGLVHLLCNMVMLLFAGQLCERALAPKGVIILYLLGAYAAAFAQWSADPLSVVPMVGASGAISALLGAYVMLYGQSRARRIGPIPAGVVNALWLTAAWSAINLIAQPLFQQAGMGIAAWAHIGGFVLGLALARPLLWWRFRKA